MSELKISLDVVFPLFMLMAVGYAAARGGILDGTLVNGINRTIFYIFMPTLLFMQIYTIDLERGADARLLIFAYACLAVIITAGWLIVPRVVKDAKKRGVVIQALFRGNFIMFGFAVSDALYGPRGAGTTALLMASVTPLSSALAVISLQYFSSSKPQVGKVFKEVAKSPFILASILAGLLLLTGVKLPANVMGVLEDVGGVASPLAIILLGATFTAKGLGEYARALAAVCSLRLFIIPGAALTAAALLGFRGEALVALLAMTSTPVAVTSFPTAEILGADGKFAAQIVIATSALSVLSIFLIVFVLKTMGLV